MSGEHPHNNTHTHKVTKKCFMTTHRFMHTHAVCFLWICNPSCVQLKKTQKIVHATLPTQYASMLVQEDTFCCHRLWVLAHPTAKGFILALDSLCIGMYSQKKPQRTYHSTAFCFCFLIVFQIIALFYCFSFLF